MTERPNKLIVVAGHAAFRATITDVPDNPESEKYWVLQSFQQGEPPYYIEHIRRGIEFLSEDPLSFLLFSGGRTRLEAGRWSEAATYVAIAKHYKYWQGEGGKADQLEERVGVEEYARDSFENVLFGLYEFYRRMGRYPIHLTIVGWEFKKERFQYHAQTLGISKARFSYVGVNNPQDLQGTLVGEKRALEQFKQDPWGVKGVLKDKRLERNPFNQTAPYDSLPPLGSPLIYR